MSANGCLSNFMCVPVPCMPPFPISCASPFYAHTHSMCAPIHCAQKAGFRCGLHLSVTTGLLWSLVYGRQGLEVALSRGTGGAWLRPACKIWHLSLQRPLRSAKKTGFGIPPLLVCHTRTNQHTPLYRRRDTIIVLDLRWCVYKPTPVCRGVPCFSR